MARTMMDRRQLKIPDGIAMSYCAGLLTGAALAIAIFAIVITATGRARAQSIDELMVPPTAAEAEDIKTWIDATCCRTSGCCRKVRPSALHPLNRDQYQVVASGQVVPRTGWSRDGQTWRCACDLVEGRWVVHLLANTRCVYPAPTGY
jgi:hypothetical protein